MKSRYVWGGILGAALAGGLLYLHGGSQVPPGQAPLQPLTAQSVAAFKDQFNAASAEVRVLVLLSPT